MRRAFTERDSTLRTWRLHLATHAGAVMCLCELQPGRFRKGRRVAGCSRPRCWLCHYEKLARIPKPQEVRAAAALAEGLGELPGSNFGLQGAQASGVAACLRP
jgi:hypothetical protein